MSESPCVATARRRNYALNRNLNEPLQPNNTHDGHPDTKEPKQIGSRSLSIPSSYSSTKSLSPTPSPAIATPSLRKRVFSPAELALLLLFERRCEVSNPGKVGATTGLASAAGSDCTGERERKV